MTCAAVGGPAGDRRGRTESSRRPHGIRFFDDWIPDLTAAFDLRFIGE
jgi:hypothetical protein